MTIAPSPTFPRATTQKMRLPVRQAAWWSAGPVSDLLRVIVIAGFVAAVAITAYFLPPPASAGSMPGDLPVVAVQDVAP